MQMWHWTVCCRSKPWGAGRLHWSMGLGSSPIWQVVLTVMLFYLLTLGWTTAGNLSHKKDWGLVRESGMRRSQRAWILEGWGLIATSEDHAIEADLGLSDSTLGTTEDDSILAHWFHELHQVLVMLLWHLVIDTYIIVDHDDTRKAVCHLVHAHLEDILGHLKTKWHVQEPVHSMVGVEGS